MADTETAETVKPAKDKLAGKTEAIIAVTMALDRCIRHENQSANLMSLNDGARKEKQAE